MGNTRYTINTNQLIKKMNAKLLYVSTSRYEGDWHSTLHTHYFAELFYVISGSGNFLVEDKTFLVKENDLVMINPNVEHTEKSFNASPLEYIVLGIEGLAFTFGGEGENKNYKVYNYKDNKQQILFYLTILLKESEEQKPEYEFVCQSLLEVLLVQLIRYADYSLSVTNVLLSKKMNKECSVIKRYIDSYYAENITLDSLSQMTHMNKYYLIHAFTKYTGLSPINYLNQRRIQEGKNLLETTNYSIGQISNILGFSSQSYFSQSFKNELGMSPNEYRKKSKNDNSNI